MIHPDFAAVKGYSTSRTGDMKADRPQRQYLPRTPKNSCNQTQCHLHTPTIRPDVGNAQRCYTSHAGVMKVVRPHGRYLERQRAPVIKPVVNPISMLHAVFGFYKKVLYVTRW